ncbi:MAG: shikimate kinase [Clostridia bacterium]|nr:shikimate kinase [Clostridia bacterium]
MKQFGLIGERLGHSHSKTLHGFLADYNYELWPMPMEAVDAFMREGSFDGMNVTIPYKKTVIPYLAEIGPTARRIGAVNTIVRRADGSLYGDNTDAYGMMEMARRAGIDFCGEKTLVLGSGGTCLTACDVVRENGGTAIVVSRNGENNYSNLHLHRDAAFIINTTPLGMYPNPHAQAVDLRDFPKLRGVLDVVYNPLRTQLMMQAEELGIPCEGGLSMLIYQGVLACEIFEGKPVARERVVQAERALRRSVTNLVLIGMPGCGKSTIGDRLAKALNMPLVDVDAEIVKEAGMSIPSIFEREGEAGFRERESEQIARFGSVGGNVLVTGGGAVKNPMNRKYLRMNGFVAHITRGLELLPMEGRPLSQSREALDRMWQERKSMYEACRDAVFANDSTVDACVQMIKEAFDEALCAERS